MSYLNIRRQKMDGSHIKPDWNFESFIAEENNTEAKQIALDFALNKSNYQTLVISSTVGNGATHLANAILNQMKEQQNVNNDDFVYLSYDVFMYRHKGKIPSTHLKNKTAILIDSYYDRSNKGENQVLESIMKTSKTKLIITCSEETYVPGENKRIYLGCPSFNEKIVIIENLMKHYNVCISKEVIHFIASHDIPSIREIEGLLTCLFAKSTLENKSIDLKFAKRVYKNVYPKNEQ